MKKYNLSNIMKRAWELVKKAGMTISSGLRKAWEEAKSMRDQLINRLNAIVDEKTATTMDITMKQLLMTGRITEKAEHIFQLSKQETTASIATRQDMVISITKPKNMYLQNMLN